ncbi:MAG: hypothetical protein PVI61_12150 [Methyloceanibacter sp.]|jgi:hypothetical protein
MPPLHWPSIAPVVTALDGSGVVRPAWAIDYVRYLRCCGHFRRAEIGNDEAGNSKDTTRSGQQGNN